MVKNLPAVWETWVQSLGGEDPLEKRMATHSSILAGKFHEQGSLVGYSPWGHRKESDMTECLTLSLSEEVIMRIHGNWLNFHFAYEMLLLIYIDFSLRERIHFVIYLIDKLVTTTISIPLFNLHYICPQVVELCKLSGPRYLMVVNTLV